MGKVTIQLILYIWGFKEGKNEKFIKICIIFDYFNFIFYYYEEKLFKEHDIILDYTYYKLPKDSIDLLFVGSSHSYSTFNTRIFDHYLKSSSLNLGTSSQSLPISYSVILEVLKTEA